MSQDNVNLVIDIDNEYPDLLMEYYSLEKETRSPFSLYNPSTEREDFGLDINPSDLLMIDYSDYLDSLISNISHSYIMSASEFSEEFSDFADFFYFVLPLVLSKISEQFGIAKKYQRVYKKENVQEEIENFKEIIEDSELIKDSKKSKVLGKIDKIFVSDFDIETFQTVFNVLNVSLRRNIESNEKKVLASFAKIFNNTSETNEELQSEVQNILNYIKFLPNRRKATRIYYSIVRKDQAEEEEPEEEEEKPKETKKGEKPKETEQGKEPKGEKPESKKPQGKKKRDLDTLKNNVLERSTNVGWKGLRRVAREFDLDIDVRELKDSGIGITKGREKVGSALEEKLGVEIKEEDKRKPGKKSSKKSSKMDKLPEDEEKLTKTYNDKLEEIELLEEEYFGKANPSKKSIKDLGQKDPEKLKDYRKKVRDKRVILKKLIKNIWDEEGFSNIEGAAEVRDEMKKRDIPCPIPENFKGKVSLNRNDSGVFFHYYTNEDELLESSLDNAEVTKMNKNYVPFGEDKEGRTYYCQYIPEGKDDERRVYTKRSNEQLHKQNEEWVGDISKNIEEIKSNLKKQLKKPPLKKKKDEKRSQGERNKIITSAIMQLMLKTGAREGTYPPKKDTPSDESGEPLTFGIRTLKSKHVTLDEDSNTIYLSFPSKGAYDKETGQLKVEKQARYTISDPEVSKKGKEIDGGGQLFEQIKALKELADERQKNGEGYIFATGTGSTPKNPISEKTVENKAKGSGKKDEGLGFPAGKEEGGATVERIRNYVATREFSEFLEEAEEGADEWDEKETVQRFEEKIEEIANKLGDTKRTILKSYIVTERIAEFFEKTETEPPKHVKKILEEAKIDYKTLHKATVLQPVDISSTLDF